jgi:hypothetical protein
MGKTKYASVDWAELKARLRTEIWEFVGPDLASRVPGRYDEIPGLAEYDWYRSKPPEERNPPGLAAVHFAKAFRDDLPISRQPPPAAAES